MIKREASGESQVKVTFAMPYAEGQAAISVVGDFNDWDPAKTKLIKRRNGTCSNSVVLDAGQRYHFRYYTADGAWINDPEADGYEVSEHGSENCILAL